MQKSFTKPAAKQSPPGFDRRAGELRGELVLFSGETLAEKTGSIYTPLGTGDGEFHFCLYGLPVTGSYPDMKFFTATGDELTEFQQLLLLYYFSTCDGSEVSGKYVSFADLPGGRMYSQAFQGYAGDEVVKAFGDNIEALKSACQHANGKPIPVGDAGYVFEVLPKVSAELIYWLGDEDFPSSCKILFDSAATHFVPIDACAIIGSTLTRKVINHLYGSKTGKS